MTELSPATQAVLDAYEKSNDCYREEWGQLAAALRAAADQVVPVPLRPDDSCCDMNTAAIRTEILAIANELENS